jgi:hypothetical protein
MPDWRNLSRRPTAAPGESSWPPAAASPAFSSSPRPSRPGVARGRRVSSGTWPSRRHDTSRRSCWCRWSATRHAASASARWRSAASATSPGAGRTWPTARSSRTSGRGPCAGSRCRPFWWARRSRCGASSPSSTRMSCMCTGCSLRVSSPRSPRPAGGGCSPPTGGMCTPWRAGSPPASNGSPSAARPPSRCRTRRCASASSSSAPILTPRRSAPWGPTWRRCGPRVRSGAAAGCCSSAGWPRRRAWRCCCGRSPRRSWATAGRST